MDVVHAGGGFTAQARGVVVVDVALLGIKDVENIEPRAPRLVEAVADLRVDQRGGFGLHAAILREVAGAKVAPAQARRPAGELAGQVMHGKASGHDCVDRAGDSIAIRRAAGEACLRPGEVRVERQPRRWVVEIGGLHAPAAAWQAGLGGTRVADEKQLGINVENPQRERALQAGQRGRTDAEFRALRPHERIGRGDKLSGNGINPREHAAPVVAVKAEAAVEVQLGLGPRTEDEAELGTGDASTLVPGVDRQAAVHVGVVVVHAHARLGPKPRRPLRFILVIAADARLDDAVGARGREAVAQRGAVEAVADIVLAELQAKGVLRLFAEDVAEQRVRSRGSPMHAAILLFELIAVLRVIEEVGKIREQIEVVIHPVEQDFRRGMVVEAMPLGLQAVARALAAGALVERAKAIHESALDRPLRELIRGRPVAAISHAGDAPAMLLGAAAVGDEPVDFLVVVRVHPRPVIVEKLQSEEQIAPGQRPRIAEHQPPVAVGAAGEGDEILREHAEELHVESAR